MTKLKNTKKGMAKKALSISLVAAMLATSNVPVWAAEFSDGTEAAPVVVEESADVDVFSAEEAPAAEEVVEDVAPLSTVITEGDISVNLTSEKKSVVWSSEKNEEKAEINGSITKGGEELPNGWLFRWVDENNIVMDDVGASDAKARRVTRATDMGVSFGSKAAGKTLTLHVYDYDASGNQILYDITTDIKVTVEKRALKTVSVNTADKDYNGFPQTLEVFAVTSVKDEFGETITNTNTTTNYTVSISSATNAEEEFKATVTAADNSPYVGTKTETVGKIKAKEYDADKDIIASTDANQTYQYTGYPITIDNSKVSLKETKSENNGKDGKLNGADLAKAIKKATVTGDTEKEIDTEKVNVPTPGDRTVTVTMDKDKLDNINVGVDQTIQTEQTVKIAKRDLSTAGTKITVNTTSGQIPTSATPNDLTKYLVLTGVGGEKLNLENDTDYTFIVTDSRGNALGKTEKFTDGNTYNITVRATKASKTCEKEQTLSVVATGATLKSAAYENKYEKFYTGSEIKPTNADLGNLKLTYIDQNGTEQTTTVDTDAYEITGYSNNINASKKYDKDNNLVKDAYVNIRIKSGTYENKTCTVSFLIKPLEVKADYVTVPEDISINKGYTKPEEYNVPVTVIAKDTDGKNAKTLTASDYTVKYEFDTKNNLNNKIKTTVTVTNPNYILGTKDGKTVVVENKETKIVAKKLTDSMVIVNPSSYTYTGGKIEPNYAVIDGAIVLYKKGEVDDGKAEYEQVSITDAVNVGTATITVKGIEDKYSGTAKGTFTITPADTNSVKVTIEDQAYTGRQVRPRDFKATLNGNVVTDQFEIVSYGENVEAGKGTVVLKPLASTKNFTGSNITVEFNIVKEKISADLKVYDSKGFDVTSSYRLTVDDKDNITGSTSGLNTFTFNGNAQTFAKAVLSNLQRVGDTNIKTTATVNDLEIKYVDNVCGKKVGNNVYNIAYIYAVAKEGTGFSGSETIVTADGTVIKGVVAKIPFGINSVKFVKQNVTVKNGTYAGGLLVKPEILIQIGGNTLVEGKDYTVKLVKDAKGTEVAPVDVTVGQPYGVEITGINGYEGSSVKTVENGSFTTTGRWGINKKSIADCNVSVKDGVVTVLNGYLPVPTTEYTSKNNGDGTYTVTAATDSKNYTGSKTVSAEGKAEDEKPDAPMIVDVQVTGNNAKVILSGNVDGATGYDYVISTDRNCITNKDYDKVNKNILTTNTTFTYTQQGTYYAYCHAWKRDENGKKVFGDWSNAYPFVVSAITPEQPGITSVKVSGSTVTVTYTKCANATGYDIVLGSAVKKVNGESRPVEYGTLVKKVTKGSTVTATFKNVKKGTYYAGLHAYNRTSEDGKKVFSPWSNTKKVTVK